MDEFVEWVQGREYYDDQIQFHREVAARDPVPRPCEMDARVADKLANRGIDELYAHQADAIDTVRNGQNVVLATPTASGKSLTYTIPALERACDHDERTLYFETARCRMRTYRDVRKRFSGRPHGFLRSIL